MGEQNRFDRRALLALASLAPLTSANAKGSTHEIRRIVTTGRKQGVSRVLHDGPPPVSFELNGTTITRLWETSELPVSLPLEGDASTTAGNAYRDGFVGTSFYIADLPAGSDAPRIPIHRNASLDYIAVLQGQVHLVQPEQTLVMNAGDVLVQGGTEHTWENRSDQHCRLLVVVITGRDD